MHVIRAIDRGVVNLVPCNVLRRSRIAEMRIEGRGQRAAVWGAAAAMFVILMLVTPKIPQDQKYHQFADKRNFYGEVMDRCFGTPEAISAVMDSNFMSDACNF